MKKLVVNDLNYITVKWVAWKIDGYRHTHHHALIGIIYYILHIFNLYIHQTLSEIIRCGDMKSMEYERNEIREMLLSGAIGFSALALRIFRLQYHHNALYHAFCENLGRTPDRIKEIDEIPFLPVRFFKSHAVKTGYFQPELIFQSSGTTEAGRSQHLVRDASWYERISTSIFEQEYGALDDYILLALLPSYLEQGDSSLVRMVESFIGKTGISSSGFYRYDFDRLVKDLGYFLQGPKKIILWGVTYALMDLAERYTRGGVLGDESMNERLIVIETGGMKGRRAELLRSEVHTVLKSGFGVAAVHSEYGMTEMLSQAYSRGDGVFQMSQSMRVMAYDAQDPLTFVGDGNSGRCHVVDLANVDSCSFIATDDICRTDGNAFEILGRLDHSDIRGCNLLYQES